MGTLNFDISTIRPKKVVCSLVFGNRLGEKCFYHSPARIVKCVSEYIFLISKNKQASKKKNKNTKKPKETKEEKRVSPENRLKRINLRPPG